MRVWAVFFVGYHDGLVHRRDYYTDYHAEQFASALRSNGVRVLDVIAIYAPGA